MLRGLLAALLFLTAVGLGAESGTEPRFLIRNWQSEEGLPGTVVRSISQSKDGYLWVATAEGLARFDGIDFHVVGGSRSYRGFRLGLFRLFTPDDGTVWLSTYQGGLWRVDGNDMTQVVPDSEEPNPSVITHLITLDDETYFLKGEIIHRTARNGSEAITEPTKKVSAAMGDDIARQRKRGRSSQSRVPDRLVDREGGIWRMSDRSLSYSPPGRPDAKYPVPEFEQQVILNDMLEDREGNVWLASPVQGLTRIRLSRVRQIGTREGLHERSVQTAIRTSDGDWWVANRSGGLDRLSNGSSEHVDLVKGGYARPVSCLFEDNSDRLWVASRDGSVFLRTDDGFDVPFSRVPAISKVNAIAQSADGTLWFAGGQGIASWDGAAVETLGVTTGDDRPVFSALAISPSGALYAGTTDGRVLRKTAANTFEDIGAPRLMANRWVSTIHPVSDDELWIATVGAGLVLFREGEWHRFDASDGLPDDRLTGLVPVGPDTFWLGSLGGIIRVSRSSLIFYLGNSELIPRWLRLDRSDGLVSRECVGGSQPGGWLDNDDTVWFPTTSGLAGIDTEHLAIQNTPPRVHIHSTKINGRPVSPIDDRVVCGPGRVRLSFSFTGLSLSAPEKVTHRVRLSGLDSDFQTIGNRREATYESVPPGRYRFEVLATNGDGVSTINPAAITIIVREHLWQTGWFKAVSTIAALLIATLVGVAIARRRLRRKLESLRLRGALENERSRISRDLHDDLGASLTELSILSALAAEAPDSPDLPRSVASISRKARNVVLALDEIVWATTPDEDSLRSLVDYLAAFAREFLDSVQIHLVTDIERNLPDLMIGPRRRHNLFLATREALNNAVKHAKAANVFLTIGIEDGELVIRVKDDGRGFDPATSVTGDGLGNLRKRLKESGGNCRFESSPGEGSTVTITLPLPKD